ncbi:hypothetical protein EDB85DRAFT_2155881 [Lactarius pseudohatsudake]|nr:hypothetical protein EDB85DRAFT_2155881 [Lactarius pseudohatsudake]
MPLFPTFSFPAEQTVLEKYENFISGIYHGEITRNTLLALDDAAPQLILFDLNKHYGLEKEALGLVESACSGRDGTTPTQRHAPMTPTRTNVAPHLHDTDAARRPHDAVVPGPHDTNAVRCPHNTGSDEDDTYRGSRRGSREALVPATLQCLKRQEIEQENFGYAPGEVSLRDRRAPDNCPGFEVCMREALRVLLGADEVEKRVEMCLAEDGSGIGTTLGAPQAMKNKKL